MRVVAACALVLAVARCTSQTDKDQRNAELKALADCIVREEIAVAPKPVDLDTAARAALTVCDFVGVLRQ